MPLIKDKSVIENNWVFISDDAEIIAGNISVSLARFVQDKDQLLAREGLLGVRLNSADNVAQLSDDLNHLTLIELNFADFADGRAFSQAWLLRNRYNYSGEIRAVGNYSNDQLFYLSRVGVNAFVTAEVEDAAITLAKLNDFSVSYQPSVN
jgi:uncharacterized protein (DUF934 family)